ncbi:MAG: hypothetical protein LBR26_03965 [Prevotella sp.]|jgi:hypothetical protein|nr:hypothetical protein [Prevotella sp.]
MDKYDGLRKLQEPGAQGTVSEEGFRQEKSGILNPDNCNSDRRGLGGVQKSTCFFLDGRA